MSQTKAYVIVQIVINDMDGYRQYGAADHLAYFEKFSGKLVAADDDVEIVEGAWPFTRTVMVEFASKELARAWYDSTEYQAVVGLRHASATSNLAIVAGYPG
jgi:uncharacterized protein (DUF1330 family)